MRAHTRFGGLRAGGTYPESSVFWCTFHVIQAWTRHLSNSTTAVRSEVLWRARSIQNEENETEMHKLLANFRAAFPPNTDIGKYFEQHWFPYLSMW